jgi:hypothetical protein
MGKSILGNASRNHRGASSSWLHLSRKLRPFAPEAEWFESSFRRHGLEACGKSEATARR